MGGGAVCAYVNRMGAVCACVNIMGGVLYVPVRI